MTLETIEPILAAITAAASIASGCVGYAVDDSPFFAVGMPALVFGVLAKLANAR